MNEIILRRLYILMFVYVCSSQSPLYTMESANAIHEYVPMLKRLASEAYWKYNDRMSPTNQINDEVKMLLITYAPLYESTITEVFNNSKFLNDAARTKECKQFIKENKIRGSDLSIFLTGIKNIHFGMNPHIPVMSFTEIKKRRVWDYAKKINIKPNELAINIEYNPAEERLFACSQTLGIVGCQVFAMLVGYGFWNYFHE